MELVSEGERHVVIEAIQVSLGTRAIGARRTPDTTTTTTATNVTTPCLLPFAPITTTTTTTTTTTNIPYALSIYRKATDSVRSVIQCNTC